jgi:hypothetical protein
MSIKPPSPAVKRVLTKLVALGKRMEARGDGWRVQCPALDHGDAHPSCDLDAGDDGRALLICRSRGCSQDAMLAGLGLPERELFLTPEESKEWRGGAAYTPTNGRHTSTDDETIKDNNSLSAGPPTVLAQADPTGATGELPQGLTLDEYATRKGLPKDFLQQLYLSTIYLGDKVPVVSIPYKDEAGVTTAVQRRHTMQKGAHADGRFSWRRGDSPTLYGLWRLPEMRQVSFIVLVEGASDAQTLWWYDVAALGLPGAGSWKEAWAPYLNGFETLYIIREPDKGGEAVEDWVTKSSLRHRVQFVSLEFLTSKDVLIKDVSDLHIRRAHEFRDCWAEALRRAVPWAELQRQKALGQVATLHRDIKDLLEDPHLLGRLKATFMDLGYVGDTSPPTLVYLAMTSRVLPRPMNAACVGPSSVGKNATVDAARALIPSEDIYKVDAASPMALIYNEASFERKIVFYTEMDSIPEDGAAGSAVRSLAATNELTYDVVEKTKAGKYQTRHIRKPGPTVLITTGTKSPGPQLGTRLLEVAVSDAPDHTWEILDRQALEDSGQAPTPPNLQPWIDLQRWLTLQVTTVRIPFGPLLLEALKQRLKRPPTRLRRDFKQLQTCIATIALLYQCQRELAPGGAVLATLDDYEEARILLEPVFATITTDGVTNAVRQTVEAIGADEEVSISELARRLGLSKTASYDRVKRALAGGWLVNREEREGQRYPARLARGTPLPDDLPVLPTKEDLLRRTLSGRSPHGSGTEQPVGDDTTGEPAGAPPDNQSDSSSPPAVEQEAVQQVSDGMCMRNSACATALVTQGGSVSDLDILVSNRQAKLIAIDE